jgi:tRNA threonylcarbamoyladenosine biosynthesis protein TsaE
MTAQQLIVEIPTSKAMRELGKGIAKLLRGRDIVFLSGPLGAGKTTLAQGIGEGLSVGVSVVSPTFTIAREMVGAFADGSAARLIHVDAYRIIGDEAPDAAITAQLFDEFESLGLDEEIDNPSNDTVILMEWGEKFTRILSDSYCEIRIERSVPQISDAVDIADIAELTSDGMRKVSLSFYGEAWLDRMGDFKNLSEQFGQLSEKTGEVA